MSMNIEFWKRHFSQKAKLNKNQLVGALEGAGASTSTAAVNYVTPVQAELEKVEARVMKKKRNVKRKRNSRNSRKNLKQKRKTKRKSKKTVKKKGNRKRK